MTSDSIEDVVEESDAKEVTDASDPLSSIVEEDAQSEEEGVGMNPQDATLHQLSNDFPVTVHNDMNGEPLENLVEDIREEEDNEAVVPFMKNGTSLPSKLRRVRKRGRTAPIAIQKITPSAPILPIPSNQYECLLVRRAILPILPQHRNADISKSDHPLEDDSVYGDTALGLKLSIADSGQVIVQRVTPLADGRASPAQLTGVIRRGDVLLAIDGVSLTENALVGLKPLQAPEDPTVPCRRQYHLRLATGAGLDILESMEAQTKRETDAIASSETVLGIFPMVDQLSGMPLFDETPKSTITSSEGLNVSSVEKPEKKEPAVVSLSMPKLPAIRLDLRISEHLATQRSMDRKRFVLSLDQGYPLHCQDNETISVPLSLPERQELGRKAVLGAFNLLRQVEQVDAGSDVRSFHSWNTTLSLYSRASIRRRRVFDAASLPSKNFGRVIEEEADENENGEENQSVNSGKRSSVNSEGIDGDELLLRLAAHDEIWRRQVVEFLENARKEIESPTTKQDEKQDEPTSSDINAALSKELGNFLFGENMSKILTKHKTPRSLPSEEVTAVLFDLATKLSTAIPDEIKASGSLFSARSQLAPFKEFKHYSVDSDVHLASRFLLESALPAWLTSFRPLAWEHRRILWPVDMVHPGGSMASSLSDDDGLTVDTTNISLYSTISRHHRRKKSIQEIIEDQELDIETRGEACFLVTFYFVHSLLPKLMKQENEGPSSILDDIATFLQDYGSYLRMDTCLVYASALKATTVLEILLRLAKHDPRHREALKQMTKTGAMVFYEPTMLSAVLQLLQNIRQETSPDRKQIVLDFCVSAYPDIQPWQVESACEGAPEVYYLYLSLLLHPIEGHDSARRDPKLVQTWCELSVKEILDNSSVNDVSSFRSNFMAVASRTSSYHLVYHRDLPFLLINGMEIKEFSLSLDLIAEILEDPNISKESSTVKLAVKQLRLLATMSLDESRGGLLQMLRRIVRLYSKLSFRKCADVPSELLFLIQYRARDFKEPLISSPAVLELIQFLADEAISEDILQSLFIGLKDTDPSFEPEMVVIIQKLLMRGIVLGHELSSSLYRIRQARKRLVEESELYAASTAGLRPTGDLGIWTRMTSGTLTMDK